MNAALVVLGSLGFLALGYRFYGLYISRLVGVDPSCPTPAHRCYDGVDYVPTRAPVLFGHHFASIAAAGPIIGPTLAALYGFLPAWLWILVGVVFLGAVHDFVSLFISVREDGRSISEIARRVLGNTGFAFFSVFAFALLILVAAAFAHLAAVALTTTVPAITLGLQQATPLLRTFVQEGQLIVHLGGIASTSVILITAFAPVMGFLLYRRRANPYAMMALGALVALGSVFVGLLFPVRIAPNLWIAIILLYVLVAAFIPVWVILQPRDFVNVQFLYLGLGLLVAALFVAGLRGAVLQMPMVHVGPDTAQAFGALWPFLFITIACGSVSGAHSLVATGTTAKQLNNEADAPLVGYCGMLMEAVLALCVLFAIAVGLGYQEYLQILWLDPETGEFLGRSGNAPLAFALAVGRTLQLGLGIPVVAGTIFGLLLLEGFLVTTIDTVVRLCRYILEEWWNALFQETPPLLRNRFVNSLIPVTLIGYLAYTAGYKTIWPVFGSANQLLAAFTLVVATVWLAQKARSVWFVAWPALFMAITTLTALAQIALRNLQSNPVVAAVSLALWVVGLGFVLLAVRWWWSRLRGVPQAAS